MQLVNIGGGIAISGSAITLCKRDEERALHATHHHPLPGLSDRSLLQDRIGHRDRAGLVIWWNGDRLLGGSRLLQTRQRYSWALHRGWGAGHSCSRLKAAVRVTDCVIRIGGDDS